MSNHVDKSFINGSKNQSFLAKLNKRSGFTLAEVLIVVGIIGVVAELTIPTLLINMQKQVYVTSLKKFYTEFNQALSQMATANGCSGDLKCTGLFASDGSASTQALGDEMIKYFNVARSCRTDTTTDITQACWPMSERNNYDGSGSPTNFNSFSVYYKFVTADGISIAFSNALNDCNTPTFSNGLGYMTGYCGIVCVDINGLKGPNISGRDYFNFYITNGKGVLLYPRGGSDDKLGGSVSSWWNGTSKTCTGTGNDSWACSGRIIEEGWQMNY